MNGATWQNLPTEMKLVIAEDLDMDDVQALARVDQATYNSCLPTLFKNVKLNSFATLQDFLENVPRSYCRYIQQLEIHCTIETDIRAKTESVIALLVASPCLEHLAIHLTGSLDKSIIPCFSYLPALKSLTLKNCGQEERFPLSERLAVSIAVSIPSLENLHLERVSRSVMHAPELVGVYPYVPLVSGDDDIPDHPILGSDLYLPSLLRIPTLRQLVIKDTHLGDSRWSTTPVACCRLQVLDIGSCCYTDEDSNRICTERIMAAVGRTIDEFSLTTSVSDSVFAKPCVTPMHRLRKLHISPFFPVDSVVDTMSNMAGSPIETVSLQCYEDDVVDVCSALEEFLALRVARGADSFYEKLTRIDVTITSAANEDDYADCSSTADAVDLEERTKAAQRLQDFCRDLRLASQVRAKEKALSANRANRSKRWHSSATDGRSRAMTV